MQAIPVAILRLSARQKEGAGVKSMLSQSPSGCPSRRLMMSIMLLERSWIG